MNLGNKEIKNIYIGSTAAAQMYFGNAKVWPEETPVLDVNAVKFDNIGNTTGIVRLVHNGSRVLSDIADWEYSSDGSNWTQWDKTNKDLSVDAGDSLYVRAGDTGQSRLASSDGFTRANKILPMSSSFKVSGPLSSLLSKNGTIPAGPTQYQFTSLFLQGTGLVDASELELPSTVAEQGFSRTFGMTSLSAAPALPATTLADSCYNYMFYNCTSLTQAPALPATTLASNCYRNMFQGCTSLTSTGNLTANYLTPDCYSYMFADSGIVSAYFPNALPSDLSGDQYTVFGKNSQCGGLTMFDNLDPSNVLVNYGINYSGHDLLSSFLPKAEEVQGVKFTATTSLYTRIQIEDVGNAAAAGGICDVVYSTDGENWTNYTVGDTITLENTNDYVIFKAASQSNSGIMSISSTEYFKFVVDGLPLVEGNLKYLYTTDPDNYYMTHDYQFTQLFYGCYFAIQYNGRYSSLTMPSQDNWIYGDISYVFDQIFCDAQIARITIPSSRNSNDWDVRNAFHWWVAGIYTDGETGILTLPSFYSITYGENSIPSGWSYEQIS